MSKNILISVVIPAFNAERFIKNALDSIMNQSFLPYEVIVVDDGSVDNTFKIVEGLYPNVFLYKQENRGPSSARNFGIQKATGDWIAFLDADDEWLPDLLENYCLVLDTHKELKWCCTPYSIINKKTIKLIQYNGEQLKNNKIQNLFLAYKDFRTKIISELISTGSVLIKKDVFMEVGLFDESFKSGEDIDLWFRISLKYPEIGYTDKVGYYYLQQNVNSITSVNRDAITIKNSILRINKTWSYNEQYDDCIKQKAKHVLNIWCYRLLKIIIRKRQFSLVNNLSKSVWNNLYKMNKIGFPIIRCLVSLMEKVVPRNKSGI